MAARVARAAKASAAQAKASDSSSLQQATHGRNRPWTRRLRKTNAGLPIPPTNITVRETHPSRLENHYLNTLRDDVMYMTYRHEHEPRRPPREIRLSEDLDNPYTKGRHVGRVGGWRGGFEPPPPSAPDNVVRLERIMLHSHVREAFSSRAHLLGAMMAFRAITGESLEGGGRRWSTGVELTRGKTNIHNWSRKGGPIGVKVTLVGEAMYDFLGTFVTCVLPRVREFQGLMLPLATTHQQTPAGVSGVVSMGLSRQAMGFFPQIEVNIDAYPRLYGFDVHFITSATGQGAQMRARALLSGFQIPFVRQ